MFRTFIICLLALSLFSCGKNKNGDEKPLARVGDVYLYPSDLQALYAPGMSGKDSITMRKKYIEKWVKKQLLLQKAELNLTTEQKDVSQELDDYRASLLIYKYEDMLLHQQMDTIVKDDEIKDYFEQHSANFVLNQPAFRGLYIKLQKSSPYQEKVKNWYKSDQESDMKDLENYCIQYARKYDYFNDEWIYFEPISRQLPTKPADLDVFLRTNHFVEEQDSSFNYYLNIKEYKLAGAVAPLNLVKEDIRSIILNKRKMKLLEDLENDIYNNAYNKDKFDIY